MAKDIETAAEQKLDTMIELLRHLLILELAKSGMNQQAIAKHLHVAKAVVVNKLKGIKKDG